MNVHRITQRKEGHDHPMEGRRDTAKEIQPTLISRCTKESLPSPWLSAARSSDLIILEV